MSAPPRAQRPAIVALVALLALSGCGADGSTASTRGGDAGDIADGNAGESVGDVPDVRDVAESDTLIESDTSTGDADAAVLNELCPPPSECLSPIERVDGVCRFDPVSDGTSCTGTSEDVCATGFECLDGACEPSLPACAERRPVVFVHGINGGSGDFATLIARLIDDGWPEEYIFTFDAEDPGWGCNVDNAAAIAEIVDEALASTCQPRVDLVAHSMGTLSSRYFVKNLGGHEQVNTYVTLGGMHHGLFSPCLAPDFLGVCVWSELCETGDYIEQLNDDPTTPGDLHWVSIYGTADETVPNESSHLDGAENIELSGVEHSGENGLLERRDAYEQVRRVLLYPCW